MEKRVVRYRLVKHKWEDEVRAEKERRKRILYKLLNYLLCFLLGFMACELITRRGVQANQNSFKKLEKVYDVMQNDFYFGKDIKKLDEHLVNGAIKGMVGSGNDPHTAYLLPKQAQEFTSSMEGSFVGIGIQYYELKDHVYMVDAVFMNSPAEEVGIQAKDQIYAIEGVSCSTMSINDIEEKIKGKAGTSVTISIKRDNKIIEKKVERRSVAHTVLSEKHGNTAVISLNTFADTSADEVALHLQELKGCKNLILDLRNNGGGYLNAAQTIASYFVPTGDVVFYENLKNGKPKAYRALPEKKYHFDTIYILINEHSASASEVLTMALKENKSLDVVVVGVNSYGKGTVQVPIMFKDGSYLKYTVAQWTTPNKNCIDGVGIKPDVAVQLDAALKVGVKPLKNEIFKADSVSEVAKCVQIYLNFLQYPIDRMDGYFSNQSSEVLKQYQKDHQLVSDGCITNKVVDSLLESVSEKYHLDESCDLQMQKALELANGR